MSARPRWWPDLPAAALCVAAGVGGCSGEAAPDEDSPAPRSQCGAQTARAELLGGQHVPVCSPLTFATNPPSSGEHYPSWGAFGVYRSALPRGFWIHNLEHGAIVVSFNCPEGCSDEVARAEQWIAALPVDVTCAQHGVPRRIILTPDPLLEARWAAVAWGVTLRAECFEAAVFDHFYEQYYGNGPEHVCAEGEEFRLPSGELDLPPGCP